MGFLAAESIDEVSKQHTREELESQGFLVARLLQGRLSPRDTTFVDPLCKELSPAIGSRITVITPAGKVLGDSDMAPDKMGGQADRPDVRAALQGKVDLSEHYNFTPGKTIIFVAVPVRKDSHTIGVVRLSAESKPRSNLYPRNYQRLAMGGAIIALLAGALSFYFSLWVGRFVGDIAEGAKRFSGGDLGYRLEPTGPQELVDLAESMNRMAEDLDAKITSITKQKVELETVLSGMVEAVFVVDTEELLLRVNRASERMFGIEQERIKGRRFHETVRNTDLHRFVSKTLAASEPLENEIVLHREDDVFLHAYGCPLRGPDGKPAGALVVLHDVTRLKVLEKIRRDFVANVSHELNTPVTAIKGFLETLKEGALKDPENAERFLDIAARHTDRLSLIIQDLLTLSRIEQDSDKGEIHLDDYPLEILGEAIYKVCGNAASSKNISIDFQCPLDLSARINPTLLEQALVNLVDNAVKYSETGSAVSVVIAKAAASITISVRDQGCGISKEYLSRIFERFYRIDKGRSRREGGTGLGLAIVKHIVNAHNGRITVDSTRGEGARLLFICPLQQNRGRVGRIASLRILHRS